MVISLFILTFFSDRLNGVAARARVVVLPESGLIAAYEPQQQVIAMFDLECHKIKDLVLTGLPISVCEASGYLFVSIMKGEAFELLVITPNLNHVRQVPGVSLYSPNMIDGRLYACDYANLYQAVTPSSRLFTEFSLDKFRYGPDVVFKLPRSVREDKLYSNIFWVHDWGQGKILLYNNSMDIHYYSKQLLKQEKVGIANTSLEPELIQIAPEKDVKNKGAFRLKSIMSANEAVTQLKDWYSKKTVIFASWAAKGIIYIAYGELGSSVNTLGKLNGSLSLTEKLELEGLVISGKDNETWVYRLDNLGPTITKITL